MLTCGSIDGMMHLKERGGISMLLQFSVTNYASIKNEVLFSLVPSKDHEHPENILKRPSQTVRNASVSVVMSSSSWPNILSMTRDIRKE